MWQEKKVQLPDSRIADGVVLIDPATGDPASVAALANLDADLGAASDASATTDTGTFSVIALIKRALTNWTTLLGRIPAMVSGRIPVDGSGVTQSVISNNSEVALSASFTRPADTTAYAAGDLIANSTTAGSVVPLSFANAVRSAGDCVRIERVRIEKTGTSLTNASFRVHLFEASPSVTAGDNGVFNNASTLATGAILSHAGSAPITMTWAGSDGTIGFGTPTTGSGMTIRPASGTTIFALVEVTAAYTPVSGETFTVILEGYRT